MLSGNKDWKLVVVRVATSQKQLVFNPPMNKHLSRTNCAFMIIALSQENVVAIGENNVQMVLEYHPKCIACIISTAKVKGCEMVKAFVMRCMLHCPGKPPISGQLLLKNQVPHVSLC